MKNFFSIAIFVFFLTNYGICQSFSEQPNRSLSINLGVGRAGTGDICGILIDGQYEKYFRKKLSWSIKVGATVHDQSDLLLFINDQGRQFDFSYRSTTAGLQVAGMLGYSFIRRKRANFGIRLGPLFRYQSSGSADDITIIFPIATGLSVPVYVLNNITPMRTYAIGGLLQPFYNYSLNGKITIGLNTGFQFDSNGDTFFPQLSLTIGRQF